MENMGKQRIKAYKGLDKNLCCRGFQFRIGEEFEQEGTIRCYNRGFHACTNPIEVLYNYMPNGENRFFEVEQYGTIDKSSISTIQASSKIKINAEVGVAGLIKAAIRLWREKINPSLIIKETKDKNDDPTANHSRIGSDCPDLIVSSGFNAKIGSNGPNTYISASGTGAKIGSSGDNVTISTNGVAVNIGSCGVNAKIASSGHHTRIISTGASATIASSGYTAEIGSSCFDATISSSGMSDTIGSSGKSARISSSGLSATIGSSGRNARISSCGDKAFIDSTGRDAVICCAGNGAIVKAKKGSWITLSEWTYSEKQNGMVPVCVKTEYVDGERIKADTCYKLVDGEFVEV